MVRVAVVDGAGVSPRLGLGSTAAQLVSLSPFSQGLGSRVLYSQLSLRSASPPSPPPPSPASSVLTQLKLVIFIEGKLIKFRNDKPNWDRYLCSDFNIFYKNCIRLTENYDHYSSRLILHILYKNTNEKEIFS